MRFSVSDTTAVKPVPTYHLSTPFQKTRYPRTISLAPVIVTADAAIAAGMIDLLEA